MGSYLTTNPNTCQVYLSNVPLQGSSMYFAGLPTVQGTVVYDWYQFSQQYPGWTSVPIKCIPARPAPQPQPPAPPPPPPPPPPPVQNPDPPPGPVTGPITGDPPPVECGSGPGLIKNDRKTSSSFWSIGGSAARDHDSDHFSRLAQPLIMGMTPVPQFDADSYLANPVYTQEPHFEVRSGDVHAIADVYHEGTGVGALVLHPPELLDLQLHGDGSNPGSQWATNLSESMLLLHSAAAVNGGDDSFTVLAFGGLHRTTTNRPKDGVYFRYTPGTPGVFTLAGTAGDTKATDRNHFRLDDLCFDLGQYATANLAALSPRAGSLVWNTTSSEVQYYNGSAWVAFGGSVTFPLEGPDDGDPAYMFDAATVPGSDLAGMKFDTTAQEGPGLFDINGEEQLYVDTNGVTIPNKLTVGGLIDPTGLELSPVAANPGGTPANTLWADSGAGNRFKIGTNTVAYLSEVGTGDLLAANNLSDLASDDTAIANLVDGATSRVPALTDTFPYKDAGDATGGKGTIQQIFDRIDDLNTASLGLSSPIAAFESGGKKTTPTAIYNLINSLTAETAPVAADKVALYDASASQTDAVTIANLFGHGKAVVIEYTGSGVSGKTVTLTGINRAHFMVLSRDASGSGPSGSWPNGGTGTINAKYYADGSNWTEWSLSAPAAGTSQVLTINGTNGAWNSSGITYRLIVVGTPT